MMFEAFMDAVNELRSAHSTNYDFAYDAGAGKNLRMNKVYTRVSGWGAWVEPSNMLECYKELYMKRHMLDCSELILKIDCHNLNESIAARALLGVCNTNTEGG